MGIGERFQRETKHHPGRLSGRMLDWSKRPRVYKSYPEAPTFPLPDFAEREMSLSECLRGRESFRSLKDAMLSLEQLSFLLWACTGIRGSRMGHDFRTAPSAGALYPVETYLLVNRVEGLERGIYHYDIQHHALQLIREGDLSARVTYAALDQQVCSKAGTVFIWTSVFDRTLWKYGDRGYRYMYLDAGHVAENLALASTAEGLGCCPIGAIYDDVANAILGVDGEEEGVIYMMAVGRR